jgi:hypothetical protein
MGSSPEPAVPAYRRLTMPRKRPRVLGVDLNRSESGGQPACRTRLSPPPPAFGERRHRRLARRLVASVRAYVGFVRANAAEYDITEVCHRSRGRPVIRCPILA